MPNWGEEGSISGTSSTLRFVDWDKDGDVDVLAMDTEKGSVWFQERSPNGTFRLHRLSNFPGMEKEHVAAEFEVVDWDGDSSRQARFDHVCFVCSMQCLFGLVC